MKIYLFFSNDQVMGLTYVLWTAKNDEQLYYLIFRQIARSHGNFNFQALMLGHGIWELWL